MFYSSHESLKFLCGRPAPLAARSSFHFWMKKAHFVWCTVSHIMVMSPQVSWLFFKARASAHIWIHTGRASNAEKQPTGRGPEGCVENGPAAALLVSYVSIKICALYCQSGSDRLAGGPF